MTCLISWFQRRRAAAFGIAFTGSSAGGVIFPILVSRLIDRLGFGWAMRICAFVILGLLVVANLTIRMHGPLPYAMRQLPDEPVAARLMQLFRNVDFVLFTLGLFLFSYCYYYPVNYLQVNALDAGMDPQLAQYLLPLLNAGSLFGRLTAGFTGDKLGRFNVFIVACFMASLWVLALWLPDTSDPALIAFALLFGFFSGAFISLSTPLIMAVVPMSEIGFGIGITMLGMAVGGMTTNPINGAILDNSDSFVGLSVFSGVLGLAGTAFYAAVRVRKAGWSLTARV